MNVILLLLLALLITGAEIAPGDEFHRDYLSRKSTQAVKGLFVILVVFSHYSQYVELGGSADDGYLALKNHLNQMVVSMFWFYSGYGILESIRKKGAGYIREFPRKRILPVFLDFAAAILLFLLVDLLIHKKYSLVQILLSFIGWKNVGNSSWYMFAVFGLYLGTWLCFLVLQKLDGRGFCWGGTVLLTLFTIAFVFWQMKMGRPGYSYNTIILYAVGMWYSLLREPVEKIVLKNGFFYSVACLLTGGVYYWSFCRRYDSIELYTVWACAFTAAVLLFTMKIRIGNSILEWFGSNVFGIYILQRIPMMLFTYFGLFKGHNYVFLAATFLTLVPLVTAFGYLTDRIHKAVLR